MKKKTFVIRLYSRSNVNCQLSFVHLILYKYHVFFQDGKYHSLSLNVKQNWSKYLFLKQSQIPHNLTPSSQEGVIGKTKKKSS